MQRLESEGQFAFSLVFEGPGLKTYRFAARDRQTQESWVKCLLSASHCYLSLLVRDLGRQYEGVLFIMSVLIVLLGVANSHCRLQAQVSVFVCLFVFVLYLISFIIGCFYPPLCRPIPNMCPCFRPFLCKVFLFSLSDCTIMCSFSLLLLYRDCLKDLFDIWGKYSLSCAELKGKIVLLL